MIRTKAWFEVLTRVGLVLSDIASGQETDRQS